MERSGSPKTSLNKQNQASTDLELKRKKLNDLHERVLAQNHRILSTRSGINHSAKLLADTKARLKNLQHKHEQHKR